MLLRASGRSPSAASDVPTHARALHVRSARPPPRRGWLGVAARDDESGRRARRAAVSRRRPARLRPGHGDARGDGVRPRAFSNRPGRGLGGRPGRRGGARDAPRPRPRRRPGRAAERPRGAPPTPARASRGVRPPAPASDPAPSSPPPGFSAPLAIIIIIIIIIVAPTSPPPRANPAPRVVPPAGGTHRASGVGDDRSASSAHQKRPPPIRSGLHPARRVPAPPRATAGPPGDGRPRTFPPSPPGARASVVVGRAASGPPPHANAPSSAYASSSRGAHNTARPPFYRAYEHWASRVGTAACRYLASRGACPHGDDCTFRHGVRDARFNPDFRDARFDRTRAGWDDRKHCVFFAKGMCRNGDACEWSHEGAVDRSNRRRVPDGGGGGGSSANGNGNGNGAHRSEDVRSEGTTPNTRDAASDAADAARLIPGATFVDDDGPPRRRAASSRRRARAGERRAGGVRGNPRDEKNKAAAEAEAEANAAASSSSSSFADADRFEGLFDGVVVDERAAHDRASPSEASGRIAFNRYAAMSRGEPPVRRGFAVADLFASDEGPTRSATPTALNTLSALSALSTPPSSSSSSRGDCGGGLRGGGVRGVLGRGAELRAASVRARRPVSRVRGGGVREAGGAGGRGRDVSDVQGRRREGRAEGGREGREEDATNRISNRTDRTDRRGDENANARAK